MATPEAAKAAAEAQARDALNKAAFSASIFKRGQKAELFEAGQPADEAAELAGKLGELHAVWSMERTGKDLAAAIWRPELGLAEVVLQRGRLLTHMGFTKGPKLYLFIEEAVYLVDRANLLLFLDGSGGSGGRRRGGAGGAGQQQRLLSLQEATDLMVSCGVPLDVYLVFAKLLRAGYIVTRHPARWALGPADDLAAVAAAAHAWGMPPAGANAAPAAEQQQQDGAAPAVQQAKQPPAAVPSGPPRKKRRVEGQQQRSGRWWVGGPAAGAQEASAAAAEAGAEGMEPQQAAGSGEVAPAGDRSDGHGKGAAGNPWLAGMPSQFLESLPRCEVLPTLAQRAAADFPRMGPLQSIPLGELRLPGGAAAGRSLLHYDVFASNSRFSRKQPGQPVYTVSVLPCWQPPTPDLMAAADVAAGGVPVRFSTIEKGDICFYGATHVELRSILM
ncbi:hypothetical protein ABPG77_005705 [Micractinium sp. CCAP 211/92]